MRSDCIGAPEGFELGRELELVDGRGWAARGTHTTIRVAVCRCGSDHTKLKELGSVPGTAAAGGWGYAHLAGPLVTRIVDASSSGRVNVKFLSKGR